MSNKQVFEEWFLLLRTKYMRNNLNPLSFAHEFALWLHSVFLTEQRCHHLPLLARVFHFLVPKI